ncbi:MAG: Gfo/Idh/MocA family oxidoreductase [Phycisphaerales bacterium]|nr:MAG: Gfo/Idh/MocA family oxidoreductase [Phycisphaerales bacterium]
MVERAGSFSRRKFLQAASLLAAPCLIPSTAWGRGRSAAPGRRITIALIGCGGMGRANLNGFLNKPQVQVLAVCDPDRSRRESARGEVEKHYAQRAASGSYRGCENYNDFRDLLARDDLDAVIIASPDHWHGLHAVAAARAGKDIYGEKPLCLTIRQGRAMCEAIRRYRRVFQTGSQQRSDRRFRQVCELVRNGRIGRVRRIICGLPPGSTTGNHPPIPVPDGFDYDLWLGPAPWAPYCQNRTHYNFRHNLDYSGGKLTDWGAHHIDIAQWALGTMNTGPTLVQGVGEFPRDGLWNAAINYRLNCRYDNGVHLIVSSRHENGVKFEGDEGWIFISRGRIEAAPESLLAEEIGPDEHRLYVSTDHRQNFLDCVRSRREPVAPIEHAHRSISIAHLGNIAMLLGRSIKWDPQRERIVGDDTASRMLDRAMREPWRL